MKKIYDLISDELNKVDQMSEENFDQVGMFTVKKANDVIISAAQRPDLKPLWNPFWYESELCCLFADSNNGKSIYAVQMADYIAKTQKVLYFDFELSDKQFQQRYTSETGILHQFSENLYRVEINPDEFDIKNVENAIISNIEAASLKFEAKILIIDNVTYLSTSLEKGSDAGSLMKKLKGLKSKHGLSILVLAHTPKRPLTSPITQNDLGGSKMLANFFDSIFTIGKSAQDKSLRYIKQIKVRNGAFVYDAENVIVASIEKKDSYLRFTKIGFATEKEHLIEQSNKDKKVQIEKIKELSAQGKTQREIAKELGVSAMTVSRALKK